MRVHGQCPLSPWTCPLSLWTFSLFIFSYLCELSVLSSYRIDPNYIEISTKSFKDVFDIGHFDFVTSMLSMTFQGTWALILALKRISARVSARKLKCSPKRRFAGFINRHLAISDLANCNISG